MKEEKRATRDLWLAGYLISHEGIGIHTLNKINVKTIEFVLVFDSDAVDFESLIRDYYNRKAIIEPRAYQERMNDLKDLLHSSLNLEKR